MDKVMTRRVRSLILLLSTSALGQQSLWQSYVDSAARHTSEGRYKQAQQLLVNALATAEPFGESDPRLALTLSSLAEVYAAQARFAEAGELLDRAVALRRKIPASQVEIANLTGQIAELRRLQGRYPEAERLHLQALEVFLSQPTAAAEDRARETARLAGLYRAQGKYAEAGVLYGQALAVLESKYGAEHASVMGIVAEFGALRQAEGRFLEAEALLRRAAAREDPEALLRLGGYHLASGDLAEANKRLHQARDALARRWGDLHPSLAEADRLLAEVALAQRQHAEAGPLLERARSALTEIFSADHPALAPVMGGIAKWHAYQGRFEEAQRLFSETRALQRASLGPDHPALVETSASIGVLTRALGRYRESETQLQQAVQEAARLLGDAHPITAGVRNDLGNTLLDLRRFDAAEAEYRRALAVREKFAGPDSPAAAGVRLNLAAVHQARGEAASARPLIVAALTVLRTALRPGHPDLLGATRRLAVCDFELGRRDEAERSFRALLDDNPRDSESLDALSRIYREQGRWVDLEPIDRKRVALREKQGAGLGAARATVDLAETLERLRREEEARKLLEEARAAIKAHKAPPEEEAGLRLALANLDLRAGRYSHAGREAEAAALLWGSASQPAGQARALSVAGNAVREAGDFVRAAELLAQSVRLHRSAESGPADLAAALHGLGRVRASLAQFDQADAAFAEEMALWQKDGLAGSEAAAAGWREWATASLARGDPDRAGQCFQQAAAILRTRFGERDSRLPAVLVGLAETELARRRFTEAESHFAAALSIQEEAGGIDDPAVAPIVNALANAQRRAGKFAQADENYRRGLALLESRQGAEHPEVATALANVAGLYREMKKHDDAVALLDRAESILRKAGGDALKLAEVLNQRGALHASRREFNQADPRFAEAMSLLAAGRGERSLDYSRISENLAFSKAMQRDFNAAERLYKQALSLREQLLGRDNAALAPLLENYGALLRLRKRDAEAGLMLDRARALRQTTEATQPDPRR